MDQIQLSASAQLQAGPQSVCEGTGGFPSGMTTVPLSLLPGCKPYVVTSGDQLANINSPSAPAALSTGSVTQAHTVYVRTAVPMVLSVTYQGNGTPQLMNIFGLVLFEVDPSHLVTALAVQGVGQVEYLVAGNS